MKTMENLGKNSTTNMDTTKYMIVELSLSCEFISKTLQYNI